MIRMIFVSLLFASSAFAGDRSIQEANPAAPMFHTGEAAYAGYCPTNPAYCVEQNYGGYRPYRQAPRRVYAPRTHIQRHRR